jgi:para-nitrobenzyl esterase
MAHSPIFTISTGQLSGHYELNGQIAVFKGIPYARPPIGDLRWKPPQPALPWQGVRQAVRYGPTAFQLEPASGIFLTNLVEGLGYGWLKIGLLKLLLHVIPSPPPGEDCLYLNIRTPRLDPQAKLPVLFWIHGGDHQDGAGSDLPYQSNALVERGVVLVTINYRLGLLGYLCHPELSRESGRDVSGNYGTLDQIAALRWVGENIAAFGGDPANITIFGESAGGESVAHLLTSPLSRGLFQRAILQSAASGGQMVLLKQPFLTRPSAEQAGQDFADKLVGQGSDQIAALRRIPARQLYRFLRRQKYSSFYPVIDGYVLEKSPFQSFLDGDQARLPLIIGSNADEGTLLYPEIHAPLVEYAGQPITPDELYCIFQDEFAGDAGVLFDLYPGLRQGDYSARVDLLGDSLIGSPARFYAMQAAKAGQPVYLYFFTRLPHSPRQTIGAFHFAESPYIFDSANPVFPMQANDHAFARQMGAYWTQFARDGDPNCVSSPDQQPAIAWPAFTIENPLQLEFGQQIAQNTISRAARYDVLDRRRLRQLDLLKKLSG